MEIQKKVLDEMNKQINEELYSEYLYLSMSAYFESINLHGFGKWLKVQASEEHAHAIRIFDFLVSRGSRVKLEKIETPKFEWSTALDAFKDALNHEKHITLRINKIMDISKQEKDFGSEILLQWFVNEQIEEEANAEDIVNKLTMIGESKASLIMLDKQYGKRGEK